MPDCFLWWDQLFQLRPSLTPLLITLSKRYLLVGPRVQPWLGADLLPTSALRWVSCKSQVSFYQVRWTETYHLPWGQSKCAVGMVTDPWWSRKDGGALQACRSQRAVLEHCKHFATCAYTPLCGLAEEFDARRVKSTPLILDVFDGVGWDKQTWWGVS